MQFCFAMCLFMKPTVFVALVGSGLDQIVTCYLIIFELCTGITTHVIGVFPKFEQIHACPGARTLMNLFLKKSILCWVNLYGKTTLTFAITFLRVQAALNYFKITFSVILV